MDWSTFRLHVSVVVASLFAAPLSPAFGGPEAGDSGRLVVEPAQIEADILYDGADVTITGTVPSGSRAAVVCKGKDEDVGLKVKGRVWGVLWMNVSEVTYENVPSYYQVVTSAGLAEIAPLEVLDRLGIGYDSLYDGDGRPLFEQFLKLKESEGLYAVDEGAAVLEDGHEGVRVRAACHLPAKAHPGSYQVMLYAFEGGDGRLVSSATVTLSRAGAASFISSLAVEQGLLYGILAVVIALCVGLLTGVVFSLGSKGAH